MIVSVVSLLIRVIQVKCISSLTTAHIGRTVSHGQPGRRARNLPPHDEHLLGGTHMASKAVFITRRRYGLNDDEVRDLEANLAEIASYRSVTEEVRQQCVNSAVLIARLEAGNRRRMAGKAAPRSAKVRGLKPSAR
jgi:hypothetical protein